MFKKLTEIANYITETVENVSKEGAQKIKNENIEEIKQKIIKLIKNYEKEGISQDNIFYKEDKSTIIFLKNKEEVKNQNLEKVYLKLEKKEERIHSLQNAMFAP